MPVGPWVQPTLAALRPDPQQLQLLEEAFDRCDRNGDGAITGPELKKLLTGLGLQPTHREMRAAVHKLATAQTGGWAGREDMGPRFGTVLWVVASIP